MSPKLKDNPPWNANLYPMFLISSKNFPVDGMSVAFKIPPMIPRSDFLVSTSLI